jgi:hypothetical protein
LEASIQPEIRNIIGIIRKLRNIFLRNISKILRELPLSSKRIGPVKDYIFSFEDYINDPKVYGSKIVKEFRIRGMNRTNSYFISDENHNNFTLNDENQLEYSESQVKLYSLKNGRWHANPYGFITSDDRLLFNESCCYGPEPINHFLLNSIKLTPCSKYSGKILLLGGSDNYWHFLMDDLSKLYFLKHADLELNDFDTIFLNKPTSRFQREYFDIFGIEYTSNNISEIKEVKHLEAEELCFFSARFQPSFELFSFLRKTVYQKLNTQIPTLNEYEQKIYISRGKAKTRKLLNEDKVINVLLKNGFSVVYLENLSVLEQVILFKNSKVILGVHGAGLTNILYASPGTIVGEIRSNEHTGSYTLSDCYEWISSFAKLKHYVILAKPQSNSDLKGRKTVDSDLKVSLNAVNKFINYIE